MNSTQRSTPSAPYFTQTLEQGVSITLPDTTATLTPYLLEDTKAKGAVIVCPGGGYQHLADHEGTPVAKAYNQRGYHAFVLRYRVGILQELETKPLYDVCTAIAMVREKSSSLAIAPNTIAICGFSAGGHAAGSAGVHWNKPERFGGTLPQEEYMPNASILCYPVLSQDYPHEGSFLNLTQNKEQHEFYSLDKQVGTHTPPAFLWHTSEDASVPVGNSLRYGEQLAKFHIPFELHVFPYGPHGLGLVTTASGAKRDDPHVARWHELSADWLDLLFHSAG